MDQVIDLRPPVPLSEPSRPLLGQHQEFVNERITRQTFTASAATTTTSWIENPKLMIPTWAKPILANSETATRGEPLTFAAPDSYETLSAISELAKAVSTDIQIQNERVTGPPPWVTATVTGPSAPDLMSSLLIWRPSRRETFTTTIAHVPVTTTMIEKLPTTLTTKTTKTATLTSTSTATLTVIPVDATTESPSVAPTDISPTDILPTSTNTPISPASPALTTGAMIGIIIGSLLSLFVIVFITRRLAHRRKQQDSSQNAPAAPPPSPTSRWSASPTRSRRLSVRIRKEMCKCRRAMIPSPFRSRQGSQPSSDRSCSMCSVEGGHIHQDNTVIVTREDGSGREKDDVGHHDHGGVFDSYGGEVSYEGKIVASNQTHSEL